MTQVPPSCLYDSEGKTFEMYFFFSLCFNHVCQVRVAQKEGNDKVDMFSN